MKKRNIVVIPVRRDNDFIKAKDLCKLLDAREVRIGAYGIFVDWGD